MMLENVRAVDQVEKSKISGSTAGHCELLYQQTWRRSATTYRRIITNLGDKNKSYGLLSSSCFLFTYGSSAEMCLRECLTDGYLPMP